MCTVSFVPTSKGTIITSNRDENIIRQAALPPQHFMHENHEMFCPVDGRAKGTWFIVRNDKSVGVLLNGAFVAHEPKGNYSMSRGRVLPDIFKHNNPLKALRQFDLGNVENFTLLMFHQGCLHECKWDGEKLFIIQLDNNLPHIYSSVTLYTTEMIRIREQWFDKWLDANPLPTQADTIHFHETGGSGNNLFGLQMNRNNHMQTVSITSVMLEENSACLFYRDCANKQTVQSHLDFIKQTIPACHEA